MQHINDSGIVFMPPIAMATDATHAMCFDTKGFDQANVYVGWGTHSAGTGVILTIGFAESDTDTSFTNQTEIVGLRGATATSSSVDFAFASAGYVAGTVLEFQLDLRKRKRYVGLGILGGNSLMTSTISVIGLLSRAAESKDTATKKNVVNKNNSNATNCALVVAA